MSTLDLGIPGLEEVELIGRGGSSRVYRARQTDLDRTVALKVINVTDDSDVARRFDRERRAMGRLSQHEGVVPVYSSGLTDNGEPYLIMPYYTGGSLQDRLEDGPVPWPEAVRYVTGVAETLTAAHDAGIVHLDLKPANILLTQNGSPRVADFGIAKLINEQQVGAKTTGAAFTPTFSSPEALLGNGASPASDVYGLGATLWALIAGRPPFREPDGDNSLMAVVGRVVHGPTPDLRSMAPDAICRVIERAMAKDPASRYPTAGEFAEALAAAAVDAADAPAGSRTNGTTLDRAGRAEAMALVGSASPSPLADRGTPGNSNSNSNGNGNGNGTALFGHPAPPRAPAPPHVPTRPQRPARSRVDLPPPPEDPPLELIPGEPGPDTSRATMLVLAIGSVVVAVVALLTALALSAGNKDNGADTRQTIVADGTSTSRTGQDGPSTSILAGPSTSATAGSSTTRAGASTTSTTAASTTSIDPGSTTSVSGGGSTTSASTTTPSTRPTTSSTEIVLPIPSLSAVPDKNLTSAIVSWTISPSVPGVSYTVYRAADGVSKGTVLAEQAGLTYTDTAPKSGTYYYVVATLGTKSTTSNRALFTLPSTGAASRAAP